MVGRATACSVDECERGGKIVRGMCNAHYDYMRAHGTTDIPVGRKTYKPVHKITEVDAARKVAVCAGCGPGSPVIYRRSRGKGFWACQIAVNSRHRRKTSESRRAYAITSKFGISIAEYDALLVQQCGVCAICSRVDSAGRNLAVDHDHDTGKVRGLLCGRCNRAIGLFCDNTVWLQSAVAYLS